jgi:N-acetylmuramoyl-L-alanine amidase
MIKVWHDPGHGGSNKGLEHEGFVERHWNLEFAQLLTDKLVGDFPEQQIARHSDEHAYYSKRAQKAQTWGADVALLHHVNGAFWPADGPHEGGPRLHMQGAICFTMRSNSARLWSMARVLLYHLPGDLRRTRNDLIIAESDNWTRDAHGHLRHYTGLGIPAILIEWGFATNPNDREALQDTRTRLQMVRAVAAALHRFEEA